MASYFVDKDHASASNSNAGTDPAAPWLTIGKANTTLTAGDTVTVGDISDITVQTYAETIQPSSSGSAGNLILYETKSVGVTISFPVLKSGTLTSFGTVIGGPTRTPLNVDGPSSDDFVAGDEFDILFFTTTGNTYSIRTPISADQCHVLGDVTSDESGTDTYDVYESDSTAQGLNVSSKNYIWIQGFTFTQTSGLSFLSSQFCTLARCGTFENRTVTDSVLQLGSSTSCTITQCTLEDEPNSLAAVFGDAVTSALITRCIIRRINGDGIKLTNSTNCIVELSLIGPASVEPGPGHQDGVVFSPGSGHIVRYNTIHSWTQLLYIPIKDQGAGDSDTGYKIYGNLFYNEDYWILSSGICPAFFVDGRTATSVTAGTMEFFSNTIGYLGDTQVAISLLKGAGATMDDFVFRNNIFYETGGDTPADCFSVDAGVTNVDSDYNLFFDCNAYASEGGNSLTSTDPAFISYTRLGGKDFHLQAGSPAISVGDPALTTAVTVPADYLDREGISRVKDSGTLGCYEATGSSPSVARPRAAYVIGGSLQ